MHLSLSPSMTGAPEDNMASLEGRMAGKTLSIEPTIDATAKLQGAKLGAYCEVGARTVLQDVEMGDYSYVVNDAQITYTSIGKFCSIAAMTRINPGNHPMQRATQAHFTYRASEYFPGESDEAEFFEWRKGHHVHIGQRLDRAWRDHLARSQRRHRRGGCGRSDRYQGRCRLHHRRRQSGGADQATLYGRYRRTPGAPGVVGLAPPSASGCAARFQETCDRGVSREI